MKQKDCDDNKNSNLLANNQCLICYDKPSDSVFMECGHGGICFECGIQICINAYSHNIMAAQRMLERNRQRREINL
jgi:hypothetical protein